MNINDLTIGQAKELVTIFGDQQTPTNGLNCMVGSKVIVRTYAAGCWFGVLEQKSGNEVILRNARRMYYWKAIKGISLSACALYGVSGESKIVDAVESVWLEAIEIIPCTESSVKTLEEAHNVEAE